MVWIVCDDAFFTPLQEDTHKAVATDFEVVRPGSGCGLFNVGVVGLM